MATTLRRKFSKGVGVAATQIGAYTAPSVTTGVFLTGLSVANTTGGNITVTVQLYDGVTFLNLATNAAIPATSSVNFADYGNRIILNSGDSVYVTSNTAASADVNLAIEEIQ